MSQEKRAGFVTIIGRPNVGKSTLMNHLIGMKLAITSRKPQTTRKRMQTVYTSDAGQIVFLDTPGIHKAANALGEYMDRAAIKTIEEVDCVLWLVEPTTYIGAGERYIVEVLEKANVPVILVINKTDTVKKGEIPAVVDAYKDLMDFKEIIPVSAKHSIGKDELLSAVFNLLPYGEPFYDEDTVTDETERNIVSELIREQALRNLSEEVPHGIAVEIDSMKDKNGMYFIDATIYCERNSHKGIVIGKGGAMLKKIGTAARIEAEKLLDCRVTLKLWVKVKKDWRNDEKQMRFFGFNKKDNQ
ncbi:MAG: GTPase Era [Lachnospiraceae bacterium]|nr:GTPase Era [Lachnospiraceae bacterium]MDN4742933.1 GTPase Era [Lachnospiraceae bacterium C1.1]